MAIFNRFLYVRGSFHGPPEDVLVDSGVSEKDMGSDGHGKFEIYFFLVGGELGE